MKRHLFLGIPILLFSHFLSAQLTVITAIGGGGRNVDWLKEKVNAEKETDGPGFFYSDCAQGVKPQRASSTLTGQGQKSYGIMNLSDDDPMTAWVEGVAGYGIGEWFEISAANVNTIYNGYQSTPLNWLNNSRVKRFKVYVDGEPHCYLDLTDEMGQQSFDLNIVTKSYDSAYTFRFEIADVYKGNKWDDVCISHVDDVACCFAVSTRLYAMAGTFVQAGVLQKGTALLTFDQMRDTVSSAEVVLSAMQRHVTLLRVKAGGKSIEITPDHPLNVEGRGFISLAVLRSETPDKSYTELVGSTKVLLWSDENAMSYYAEIESIEELHGDFQTVTVRQLSNGSMYIANGFVSQTY